MCKIAHIEQPKSGEKLYSPLFVEFLIKGVGKWKSFYSIQLNASIYVKAKSSRKY